MSFFGGGTDYPLWFRENGGAVLSTTIDKYAYVTCRHLPPFFDYRYRVAYSQIETAQRISEIKHPVVREVLTWMGMERGLNVQYDADLPARSGLGTSSAFTVGLINALKALEGRYSAKSDLARNATLIEREKIGEAVGCQDQVAAAHGGFNRIEFHRNGSITVDPLIAPAGRISELRANLMLLFTGFSRIASKVAQSKVENIPKRSQELLRIAQMVDESVEILQDSSRSISDFGRLLHEGWMLKRSLSDLVSTPLIDEVYKAALDAGAVGGKLLGAGGGGFLLLFVRPADQPRVREALGQHVVVPFEFESTGSRIALYQPGGLF